MGECTDPGLDWRTRIPRHFEEEVIHGENGTVSLFLGRSWSRSQQIRNSCRNVKQVNVLQRKPLFLKIDLSYLKGGVRGLPSAD